MPRAVWKGPFVEASLLRQVEKAEASGKGNRPIKTWSRKSTIIPPFVGKTFAVYNGKKFIPVLVKEEMVGRKLGEYSPTRTYTGHGKDK